MKYILFILSCSIFACTSTKEQNILKVLKKQYQLPTNCAVLLIPNGGCTGCISNAEGFASKHLVSDKLFVNMVELRSKKLVAQKLGADFLFNPKVKIDKEGELKRIANVTLYPKIIYLEAGQITKIVEASPAYKGNAWAELKKYLEAPKAPNPKGE